MLWTSRVPLVELGATSVRREPQDPDVVELAPRGPGRHIEKQGATVRHDYTAVDGDRLVVSVVAAANEDMFW